MTPEDRLRQAMEARASRVEPSADALSRIEEKLMDAQRSDNRKRLLLGLGAAAAVVAIVIGVVALTDDDDEPVSSDDTTTTTTESSTTTSTTESTTTTTTFQGVDPAVPVFPDPTTSQRFDEPRLGGPRVRDLDRLHRPGARRVPAGRCSVRRDRAPVLRRGCAVGACCCGSSRTTPGTWSG